MWNGNKKNIWTNQSKQSRGIGRKSFNKINILNNLTPKNIELLEVIYSHKMAVNRQNYKNYSDFNFDNLIRNKLIKLYGDGIIKDNFFKLHEKYVLIPIPKINQTFIFWGGKRKGYWLNKVKQLQILTEKKR